MYMLTNRERRALMGYIKNADIPMLMLIGWGVGFLIIGILWVFLGTFMEAGDGEIWSFKAFFSGILVIGISVCVGLIAKIYWHFSQRKSGTLYPKLNGFGLILAIISAFSGAILGSMVIFSL